jgi:prophage regulatory protein
MNSTVEPMRMLSLKATANTLGVSVRTLQRMVRQREFPVPVRLSPGRVAFYEQEVKTWLADRPRTRMAA